MLIEQIAIAIVLTEVNLKAVDFFRPSHQIIFSSIERLYHDDEPVDLITLQDDLKNRIMPGDEKQTALEAVGGIIYITALFDTVPSAANVEHYARRVQRHANRRRAALAAYHLLASAAAEQADDSDDSESLLLLDAAEGLLSGAQTTTGPGFTGLPLLANEQYDLARRIADGTATRTGVPTGFGRLDTLTSGLQPADLIIVAGRPSMGKTSLVLSIAETMALVSSITIAIFSLEMSREQLALRMLCSASRINSHKVRSGGLNESQWYELERANRSLSHAPILINDDTEASPLSMRLHCRRIQRDAANSNAPLGLVVVDYLQLMRGSRRTENRQQEIGEIAKGLKQLARELRVPVIALSQLSRAVESRENKRPILSDLRDSGSVEAEADLVWFLYRESYYQQKAAVSEQQDDGDGDDFQETELIIAKHRSGATGTVKIGFWPQYARFQDIDRGGDGDREESVYSPDSGPRVSRSIEREEMAIIEDNTTDYVEEDIQF